MLHLPQTLCLANLAEHMIHIPGGTFMMGGENMQKDAQPEHLVSLDGFYLCRFPVSQKLWEEVMGRKPAQLRFQDSTRPVERVSWNAIEQEFLPALREKTGVEDYCLPTEAQWEYAARGGEKGALIKQDRFEFSGSHALREIGWYKLNSLGETQSLGLKRPNTLGLYDMSGNIREWCQDWYGEKYYQTLKEHHGARVVQNPSGPKEGGNRVVRGGAWYVQPAYASVALRFSFYPHGEGDLVGFRLCRNASP
ncbi:MAG: formylglycine-generating enzyme family protein [Bacteroidota bacterium]